MRSGSNRNMPPLPNNPSTMSSLRANILLFCVTTLVLGVIAGVILNGLNRLPGYILAIGVGIGSVTGVLSVLLGLIFEKPNPNDIWAKANVVPTLLLSCALISLLTWEVWMLPPSLPNANGPTSQPTSIVVMTPTSAQPTLSGDITATPQGNLSSDPYTHKGMLILDDPLNDKSKGSWDVITQNNGMCQFPGQGYHLIVQPGHSIECNTNNSQSLKLTNFVYRVTMTVVQGDTPTVGGIVFRYDDQYKSFYYFTFDEYGQYRLGIYQNGSFLSSPLTYKYSDNFHRGLGVPNLLDVVVVGNRIELFVNGKAIDVVIDSNNTLSSGQIGVYAECAYYSTITSEVVFSHAQLWKL